jgi:hypothetical protein
MPEPPNERAPIRPAAASMTPAKASMATPAATSRTRRLDLRREGCEGMA